MKISVIALLAASAFAAPVFAFDTPGTNPPHVASFDTPGTNPPHAASFDTPGTNPPHVA